MNYPDDFNDAAFDNMWSSADEELPVEMERLEKIHNVYLETLSALIASCKKNKVLLAKKDVEVIMEAVGEALADPADDVLPTIREAGFTKFTYTPENCDNLVDKAHEELVDSFRVKPIDYSKMFNDMFAPCQSRASLATLPRQITNPATFNAVGEAI